MISWSEVKQVIEEVGENWGQNRCSSMAAAIAFRSLFSLIPLVFLLALISDVSTTLVNQLGNVQDTQWLSLMAEELDVVLVDVSIVEVVNQLVRRQLIANGVVVVIGLIVLIVGATSVFNELIISVNGIWGVKQLTGLMYVLKQRIVAFGLIVGLGILMIFSFVVRGVLLMVDELLLSFWSQSQGVSHWLGWLIMPVIVLMLVVMINKSLPRVSLKWGDVLVSGVLTTPLFLVGQVVLGWYLSNADLGGKYGGFGSYIVFMLWVYYSSIILLSSVQITKVYAERWGSRKS